MLCSLALSSSSSREHQRQRPCYSACSRRLCRRVPMLTLSNEPCSSTGSCRLTWLRLKSLPFPAMVSSQSSLRTRMTRSESVFSKSSIRCQSSTRSPRSASSRRLSLSSRLPPKRSTSQSADGGREEPMALLLRVVKSRTRWTNPRLSLANRQQQRLPQPQISLLKT